MSAPTLLDRGGRASLAANRAGDAFLARATGKKWRWPRVEGVQLADADSVATGVATGDPLEVLLAFEAAAERLARGAPPEPAEDTRAAAARANRCARSVQLETAARARAELAGQLSLPCLPAAALVYKTRRARGQNKRGAA